MSVHPALNSGHIRLRLFLKILVAFVVGGVLLVKYTYDNRIDNLKQDKPPTPESLGNELLLSALKKTDFKVKELPISVALKEEETAHNKNTLSMLLDLSTDETENTKMPIEVTTTEVASIEVAATEVAATELATAEVGYSLQQVKTTSEASFHVEAEQRALNTLIEDSYNTEMPSTVSTGIQTTTSGSEMLETHVHSSTFVSGSQADSLTSCGNVPLEGLKQVTYDSDELLDASKRISPPGFWSKIKPATTSEERNTFRMLLHEFIKICELNKIVNYFIFSGTLLGSYRHHGLQPWDDDVDILMQHSDQVRILDVFGKYAEQSQRLVAKFISERMKLYHRVQSIPISGQEHRWPFVDISFYYENETHIWELFVPKNTTYHITPKTLIFPLHLRPFESVMLNAPRDAFAVLKLLFNNDQCVTLTWLHKTETWPWSTTISFNCEKVASIYPFVHRAAVGNCVEESLWLNDTVLYSVLIEEPTYAISMPFRLQLVQPSQFSVN